MEQLDPDLKALFEQCGITSNQLQDQDTANFIYDFIEQRGGLDAVKKDRQARPPPPPIPSVPALPGKTRVP
jgi:Wiskott-Aldrich syndrome protein